MKQASLLASLQSRRDGSQPQQKEVKYVSVSVIKKFPQFPFGHRQALHTGHCSFIHGHSALLELKFSSETFDEKGFVIDFGQLDYPKSLIKQLDHGMLVAFGDEDLTDLIDVNPALWKPTYMPSPSIEGLAWWFYQKLTVWVHLLSPDRTIKLEWVRITEDDRNTIEMDSRGFEEYSQYLAQVILHDGYVELQNLRLEYFDEVKEFLNV